MRVSERDRICTTRLSDREDWSKECIAQRSNGAAWQKWLRDERKQESTLRSEGCGKSEITAEKRQ